MTDPYKVLGVSESATPDEIKKAYRTLAKKYHPDTHPDDPNAAKKMSEINEAYDLLSNPEKMAAQKAKEEREAAARQAYSGYGSSGSDSGSGYGSGYGSYGSYGRTYRTGYGWSENDNGSGNGYGSSRSGNSGYGGWYSDFGGFNFDDIFGFGTQQTTYDTIPQPMAGDTTEMVNAINCIHNGQYKEAIYYLSLVTSSYRDARWYYVAGVAYHESGDTERGTDLMRRAAQMDPSNAVYVQLLQTYMQGERTSYQDVDIHMYRSPFGILGKVILGIVIFRIVTFILQLLMYGGGMFYFR